MFQKIALDSGFFLQGAGGPPELMLRLVPPAVWLSISELNTPSFPRGCALPCTPSGWLMLKKCFSVSLC